MNTIFRKKNNYRYILVGVIAVILTIVAFFSIKNNSYKAPTVDPFDLIEVGTSQESMTEEDTRQYNERLDKGLLLLREGDNGNKQAFNDAIAVYKEAAGYSKYNNWMPYYHLGNIYRRLGEYEKADQAFSNALKITGNTELAIYLSRIEMYRYELQKSNDEIKRVYGEALQFSNDINNLEVSYAGFLKDIGDKEEAITYYKKLLEKYPGNQIYQQEIEMLSK